MKMRRYLAAACLGCVVACGDSEQAATLKAEAEQAGVSPTNAKDSHARDGAPESIAQAQAICASEISRAFGMSNDDSVIQDACRCVVQKVGLKTLGAAVVAQKEAGISAANSRVIIDMLEQDETLSSECLPFL